MKGFKTAEELEKAVRARLRQAPDPILWAYLRRRGLIEGALEDSRVNKVAAIDALTSDYRGLKELVLEASGVSRAPSHATKHSREDARPWALALIHVEQARRLRPVVEFRRRVLRDHLIDPREVARWLTQQEREQGPG